MNTAGVQRLPDGSDRELLDAMIESMPGVLYLCDREGRFLRWNRRLEQVSGYGPEQIAGLRALDLFAACDQPRLRARIDEALEAGASSVEADLLCRDGTRLPYLFTGRRLEYARRTCLVGVGIDISLRRRAEERLSETEGRYRELVENANSIILRWNADGAVTLLNEYGQRFFGYSSEEILGRHVIGTIVPCTETSGRDLQRLMDEICADPEAFEQNVNENVRRSGERVWIAWTNKVVRDAEGRLEEILSIGTDITERRRAEEAQREIEARYRKLFERAPDGIWISDASGACLDGNASLCRMLGYERDELVGLRALDVMRAEDVAQLKRTPSMGGEANRAHECSLRRKDGSLLAAELIATRMPDGNVLGMVRDVTDRKLVEAERERRHRAETADRIKSAFLATMSHELRTPLNSIIGFTGILCQGLAGPLNDEQRKQLDMVRSSARHLLSLVNDVLDLSKIEAGQLQVAREPFDAAASVRQVAALVRPLAEEKGLELAVELAPGLGDAVGDVRRFEQILLNLLSNAVKFTERGGITLSADRIGAGSEARAGESALRLRVADTGVGIEPEDLPRLFEPFRQLDSGLSRRHEGTGLGLTICRRLVELQGGTLDVESEWGRGSVFTAILPVAGSAGR